MAVVAPSPPEHRVEPDALAGEARGRRVAAAFAGLVVVAGTAYAIVREHGGAPPTARRSSGPVVDATAFAHHGRLAFISRGTLWVLDGAGGSLRRLPKPPGYFAPQSPMFSPDGKWLSYLEASPNGVTPPQLWIARGDGSDPERVRGIPQPQPLAWSPRRDVLAVLAGPERAKRPCPCFSPTTLRIVRPNGASRIVQRGGWIYGAVWSPQGDALAAASGDRRWTWTLTVDRLDGRAATVWLSLRVHDRLDGMDNVILDPAGWWRGVGIGLWVFGDGAVHNNDATPLYAVARPHARPDLLGQTLSDGTTDAVAGSRRGGVAIVTDHGGGRAAWQDKQLVLCGSDARCNPVEAGSTSVTLDPAWSPDGEQLAFVEAPNIRVGPWTQRRIAAWYAAHRLVVYDAATHALRRIGAAKGATVPAWSRDGRFLLYVADDGLWLLPQGASKPAEIAAPLFARSSWPQYYAQIPWTAQFAWWSP